MAAVDLTVVEQINFSYGSLAFDSLGSVVDPNMDFKAETKPFEKKDERTNVRELETESKSSELSSQELEIHPSDSGDRLDDVSSQRFFEKAKDGVLTEADFLYSYDSVEYPTIPLSVAQYLNQHSPDLYKKAKDILMSSDSFEKKPSVESYGTPPSPLKAMANTSEALALQQSVIGGKPVKPAPPEIVAQVVASTRNKMKQNNKILNYNSDVDCSLNDQKEVSSKIVSNYIDEHKVTSDTIAYSDLIEYPPDLISASIERKTWLSSTAKLNNENYQSSTPTSPQKSPKRNLNSRRSSQSSISSVNSRHGNANLYSELPATHSAKKGSFCENILHDTTKYSPKVGSKFQNSNCHLNEKQETESCLSEKFEVESVYSDAFETESNFSDVSGVDEEMFQIRKLLTDPSGLHFSNERVNKQIYLETGPLRYQTQCFSKSSSTQTVANVVNQTTSPVKSFIQEKDQISINFKNQKHQSTETDNSETFDLLRQNAHLEGQLETLKMEMESVIKDKTDLQSVVTCQQTQLKSYSDQIESFSSNKEKILQESKKMLVQKNQWDNVITEYQSVINSKAAKLKAMQEDLTEAETSNKRLKMNYDELKLDVDSKQGTISGLKKKIAELHIEVQTALQGKVQVESDVKNLKVEMKMLRKSKEWYQEQLHSTQENRNKIHQELILSQGNYVSLNNSVEQFKIENSQLKQQLKEYQQRAVKEKEVLMKHLETIEADMMEREALFEEIQKDKGTAEESLAERAIKVEEEKSRLTHLNFLVSDLEYQLQGVKNDVKDRDEVIKIFEKEKAEFARQIALLQKMANTKDLLHQQQLQVNKDLELKLKHLEMALKEEQEQTMNLKIDKTSTEVALTAANEEKKVINEALKGVKDNLNRVENNFKQMKTELVSKSSQLEQVLKEKYYLEDSLRKSEEEILSQKTNFEMQTDENSENKDMLLDDLRKQKLQLEHLIEVLQKDVRQNQLSYIELQKKFESTVEEFTESQKTIKTLETKCSDLEEENFSLAEQLRSQTNIVNADISENVPNNAQPTLLESENKLKSQEALIVAQKEFKTKQRIYESNIKVLTRKLREKMKDCKNYQNELKRIQEEGRVANEQYSQVTASTTKTMENEILQCKEKFADLEKELSDSQELNKEQKKLLEENQKTILLIEKEKGRLLGLSESQSTLKQHVSTLEDLLVEKETLSTQLLQKVKDMEQQKTEDIKRIQDQLNLVEEQLGKEKAVIKELRYQIFQEKRENSILKRHLMTFKSSLEQSNQTADARKQELSILEAELNVKHQAELKHRAEMEQLQTEYHCCKAEMRNLAHELEETKSRDPALAEQLKSLSWHLKEKNQEINAMKEQLHFSEQRHKSELEILNNQIQALKEELAALQSDLAATRKEKFSYQSRIREMRKALKSSVQHAKQLQTHMKHETEESSGNSAISFNQEIPEPPALMDEEYINSLLQQSLAHLESRPLSNLQACLSSLKQEMDVLQQQINKHSEASKDH